MKIATVIACRMGSSRLPGKTTKPILGKPMIQQMVERVQRSRHVTDVMLATSTESEDDPIEALTTQLGIGCFRGSPEDVLDRIDAAAQSANADLIVELLGDNPLVHSDLIDDVIEYHQGSGNDYSASVTAEYPHAGPDVKKFPVGIRVQVFPPSVLHDSAVRATDPYHRENSTTFLYEHPDLYALGYLQAEGKWARLHRPELTFAVNFPRNFELVSRIFERNYPKDPNFTLFDAIATYDADPALAPLMGNE
jgi:spore coat polysaccharide biosynthesis protein SpsF